MDKAPKTTTIFQDDIGVSKTGKTNIYSPGYCGCLAVIISNAKGPGGMVAHISQMGNKGSKEDYLLETTNKALDVARQHWGKVNVVLWRGDVDKNGIEFPGMPQRLLFNPKNAKFIQNIQDLRPERDRADKFIFDTEKHVLYPIEKDVPSKLQDKLMDAADEIQETTKTEKLTFETGRKTMTLRNFE